MCVCINGFKARNQKKPAIFSEAKDPASERQYNNPTQVLIFEKRYELESGRLCQMIEHCFCLVMNDDGLDFRNGTSSTVFLSLSLYVTLFLLQTK